MMLDTAQVVPTLSSDPRLSKPERSPHDVCYMADMRRMTLASVLSVCFCVDTSHENSLVLGCIPRVIFWSALRLSKAVVGLLLPRCLAGMPSMLKAGMPNMCPEVRPTARG